MPDAPPAWPERTDLVRSGLALPDLALPDLAVPDTAVLDLAVLDLARFTAAIRGGAPFVALLGGLEQGAVVDAAVDELRDEPIAFVRIDNPLRAPLTLERLVFQLTSGDSSGAHDQPERVWQALLNHVAGKERLVLVVGRAETLAFSALLFLQSLPGLREKGAPPVQIAFTGAPEFHALLADNRLRVLRDALSPPPAPPVLPAAAAPSGTGKGRARVTLLAGVGAVLAMLAVLVAVLAGHLRDNGAPVATAQAPREVETVPTPAPPVPPSPTARADAAPASALVPTPEASPPAPNLGAPADTPPADVAVAEPPPVPAPPAESAENARARLYREFTAFLEQRGMAGRLSRSDRQALFEEYLARHRTTAAAPGPVAASPAGSAEPGRQADLPRIAAQLHVVLMVPPDSASGEASAERLAGPLRDKATDVATRLAPAGIAVPTIRYFFPDDRGPALSLARDLPAPGDGDWVVEDMTSAPARPDAGTVEVWLPRN